MPRRRSSIFPDVNGATLGENLLFSPLENGVLGGETRRFGRAFLDGQTRRFALAFLDGQTRRFARARGAMGKYGGLPVSFWALRGSVVNCGRGRHSGRFSFRRFSKRHVFLNQAIAAGIERGCTQSRTALCPRAAEATLGATAKPLGNSRFAADNR